MPNPVMGKNRCRVDIVGAHTNMATADDDDLASRLQFLLKTKWTIDDDKYNSDAFDQCEGAWPIAHPLPLPLWSNTIKKPFVVENVNISFIKIRLFSPFIDHRKNSYLIFSIFFSYLGLAI